MHKFNSFAEFFFQTKLKIVWPFSQYACSYMSIFTCMLFNAIFLYFDCCMMITCITLPHFHTEIDCSTCIWCSDRASPIHGARVVSFTVSYQDPSSGATPYSDGRGVRTATEQDPKCITEKSGSCQAWLQRWWPFPFRNGCWRVSYGSKHGMLCYVLVYES